MYIQNNFRILIIYGVAKVMVKYFRLEMQILIFLIPIFIKAMQILVVLFLLMKAQIRIF